MENFGKIAPGVVGFRPFNLVGIIQADYHNHVCICWHVCLLLWVACSNWAPAFIIKLHTFRLVYTEAGGLRSPRHLHSGRLQQDHRLLAPHPAGRRPPSKHLYWEKLARLYNFCFSLLLHLHSGDSWNVFRNGSGCLDHGCSSARAEHGSIPFLLAVKLAVLVSHTPFITIDSGQPDAVWLLSPMSLFLL